MRPRSRPFFLADVRRAIEQIQAFPESSPVVWTEVDDSKGPKANTQRAQPSSRRVAIGHNSWPRFVIVIEGRSSVDVTNGERGSKHATNNRSPEGEDGQAGDDPSRLLQGGARPEGLRGKEWRAVADAYPCRATREPDQWLQRLRRHALPRPQEGRRNR